MPKRPRVLLQTTITTPTDDWGIVRFSKLAELLRSEGFDVVARDRDPLPAPDSVLSTLDTSDFDAAWLFAVDTGDGLTTDDCAAISRFRRKGRGLFVTRDHMDLGSSVCDLGGVGKAHYFHSKNLDPDAARHAVDDAVTTDILWPNYHSGANGDWQQIAVEGPRHPVLDGVDRLPAHPHEGGVGAPADEPSARVIATGTSLSTGRRFNLAVAFEAGDSGGPAIAASTFHHFADYNWDPATGSPSFVTEAPGDGLATDPAALASAHRYAVNIANWLVSR
ncbi:hypothetical protein [Polymorphobacter megasporae]|uniref:hypothetical protein n=1 Tax=Glacieibacterium megasporae TaxID=2835787 RepID=UPI001C1DE5FA|nr:hypothetical protein [Polymorphobacter megasporae]UAJ11185.1 hypothetical protein KTC28_05625 [Polymorphobacter megasporae]